MLVRSTDDYIAVFRKEIGWLCGKWSPRHSLIDPAQFSVNILVLHIPDATHGLDIKE